MTDISYRKLFKEINFGASPIKTVFGDAFIKHIDLFEQYEIEQGRENYIALAKDKGLPAIKEALILLDEEGHWTAKEEDLINQEQSFISKLSEQKKNTYLKSQLDSFDKQLNDAYSRLNKLKNKRNQFLGNTCENYADQRMTEDFVKMGLYKDLKCSVRFFTDEEFDDVDISNLSHLIGFFNTLTTEASDLNIQKMVLQDFFSYYMPYCEDPFHFFGKPVVQLSLNQLKTLMYSRYFKNILSNNDKIPDQYRKDPEKIIDYVNANQKAKEMMEKGGSKEGAAQSIMGATKEDYKYLNMDKGQTKSLSLAEEAKKKGGSLDMKDFMNLMGV